jgi:hypothetical protein
VTLKSHRRVKSPQQGARLFRRFRTTWASLGISPPNVLYWAANVVALLFLLPGEWGWFLKANPDSAVMAGTNIPIALGVWLLGRACRYVLVGQQTRKCSHCAEFIKPEAIVCKHCGSDVVSSKDIIDDFIK